MKLIRHPWNQIHYDYEVSCHTIEQDEVFQIMFQVRGRIDELNLSPASEMPIFRDEIWQSTCFELFVLNQNKTSYSEFNFAPNGDWAVYHFDDYRKGIKKRTINQPEITLVESSDVLEVTIKLENVMIAAKGSLIGLCAILETPEGKSYWAVKHNDDKPDFHQKDCFLCDLEAR